MANPEDVSYIPIDWCPLCGHDRIEHGIKGCRSCECSMKSSEEQMHRDEETFKMKTLKDYQKVQPTPGPWEISKNSEYLVCGYDPRCYPDNERVTVANIDPMGDAIPAEVGKANARLIAAAPELLAALNKIAYEPIGHSEATDREVLDGIVEIAREAIAKAEGTKS